MKKPAAKRFYKSVSVADADGGFIVQLDGRTLKTPGKHILLCSSRALAEAVAHEWDGVEGEIDPSAMPITRMMNVVVERTPETRDDLVAEARRYAGTDLLCYRASAPDALVERQTQHWSPWLDWAGEQGIALRATDSLIAIEQDEAALDAIAGKARAMDDLRLTLFVHLTAVYGSAILALAVMNGALEAGAAFDLSRLDANFQIERWGEDEEAAEIAAATRAETLTLASLKDMSQRI